MSYNQRSPGQHGANEQAVRLLTSNCTTDRVAGSTLAENLREDLAETYGIIVTKPLPTASNWLGTVLVYTDWGKQMIKVIPVPELTTAQMCALLDAARDIWTTIGPTVNGDGLPWVDETWHEVRGLGYLKPIEMTI